MARYKHNAKKRRMAAKGRQTKWAPFWVIPKVFGTGRRIHPSRITETKRHWRRNKLKI